MVDKSSVEAVDKANEERKKAIKDMAEGIRATQSHASHEIYEAHQKQKEAERKAKEATETLKERSFLYMGLLAFTLLCVAIMNTQVVSDFIDFFTVPATGIYEITCEYINWLISLSNKMETGWAWIVRILLTLLIITFIAGIGIGITALIKWYKQRWCTLSIKTMVISLSIITVFGEHLRSVVSVNLILIFLLIQIGYLFVLWYFDSYFENRYRTDEWKAIQNR